MITYTIVFIIIGIIVVLTVVRMILRRLGSDFFSSVDSWTTYFRGPGALQLGFLVVGGLGAVASVRLAPYMRNLSVVGQVREYDIDVTKPSLRQENIQNYSYITMFARVTEPSEGKARLRVFRKGADAGDGDTSQLDGVNSLLWSRLDLPNNYSTMGTIVEPSVAQGETAATKVHVLVYYNLK